AAQVREETMWLAEACQEVGVTIKTTSCADDPNARLVDEAYDRIKKATPFTISQIDHDILAPSSLYRAVRGSGRAVYPNLDTALQAVLQTQVVATWTAFEVLAGDL